MRVLHFAEDGKFLPFAREVFETVFPGQSTFRLVGVDRSTSKSSSPDELRDPDYWCRDSEELKSDLAAADVLIVHYMGEEFATGVAVARDDTLIVWSGWGGDYYSYVEPFIGPLVMKRSDRLDSMSGDYGRREKILTALPLVWRLPRSVRETIGVRRRPKNPRRDELIRLAAERVDVVSFPVPTDLPLFRRAFPRCTACFHRIPYGSAEVTFEAGPKWMSGPDILIGNSATPTNNHAEAFELLRSFDLTGRRVVVPLSYGSKEYARGVVALGRRKFGRSFVPLQRFLPLAEYNQMIGGCGTVLMNHVRQQAVGNIASAVYKGAKVVFGTPNPVALHLKNLGVHFAEVDSTGNLPRDVLDGLQDNQRRENRMIVGEYWAHQRALASIREIEGLWRSKRSASIAESVGMHTPTS